MKQAAMASTGEQHHNQAGEMTRTSALVVGAGPVGLTAGCLLSAYGRDVLVVERNPTTSQEPKAISLDDESMRTLKLAQIGEALDKIVGPGTGTQYHDARGRKLFRAVSPQPLRFGHPFKNPFAQPELESVLRAELESREHVEVRWQAELTALLPTEDGVRAELRDVRTGSSSTVAATFVIACDGGRSTVRELLGVEMRGRSYDEPWLVVDVKDDSHRQRFGLHFGTPSRPTVIIPGIHGRCRYEFRLMPGEGEPGRDPAFALIERLISPYRSIVPGQIERSVVYRFNAVVAERWRDHCAFLAGDAAHMMPPFAGQGLNSGIRDAANLCWKIDAVLAGSLDESGLDTYEQERRPNVEATVRLSERLGNTAFTTNPRHARLRDVIVRTTLATRPGRRWLEEMRYRPTTQLRDGLVITGPDRVGSLLEQPVVFDVGAHRAANLDQVLGRGWSLLGVDTAEAAWGATLATPLVKLQPRRVSVGLDDVSPPLVASRSSIADYDGRLQTVFGGSRGHFLLVRPDRVIAAEFAPSQTAAVAAAVARWQPDRVPADPPPAAINALST
jgi:3-(3-hydroxy-phenyl)propionate hydroxylase